MKKIRKSNIHVKVYPRHPGDFGLASISGQTRSEEETIQMCEEIVRDVKKHVDNLPSSRGVGQPHVAWDDEPVCEHCGSDWSEESDTYNGGCCAKDELNNPSLINEEESHGK